VPPFDEASFWRCVWGLHGSIIERIWPQMLVFSSFSVVWLNVYAKWPQLELAVGPIEVASGALGLLLVLRTNAGYDRWWEGRKLWGAIVNHTRSLVTAGIAYGPPDAKWRGDWVRTCAAFGHACRLSLRSQRNVDVVLHLLGDEAVADLQLAYHMPSQIAQRMAIMLGEATAQVPSNRQHFLAMEQGRQHLLACIGSCERIASTPLPRIYVLMIRRFIAIYLFAIPLAMVGRVGWPIPFLVMLVAYPALGMDRIAQELQNPFLVDRLSHLQLELICKTIENNAMALLDVAEKQRPTKQAQA
jgi:putative membrane protein